MPQYFGFNDDYSVHQARPWQPPQLQPNAFRFGFGWNWNPSDADTIATNMGLRASGSLLGIMNLYAGYGQPPPDNGSFFNAVNNYLNATPSNLLIQVWNEPNNINFGNISAAQCRELIRSAYKADNGRGRVIGPGLAPNPGWSTYMMEAYADHYVPAAVHIYPSGPANWVAEFDEAMKFADKANADPVDPSKPIYITEMAFRYKNHNGNMCFGSDYYGYAQQGYIRAAQRSNVRAVLYHRLFEVVPTPPFDSQGLTYFLNNSGNPTLLTTSLDGVR